MKYHVLSKWQRPQQGGGDTTGLALKFYGHSGLGYPKRNESLTYFFSPCVRRGWTPVVLFSPSVPGRVLFGSYWVLHYIYAVYYSIIIVKLQYNYSIITVKLQYDYSMIIV